MKSIYTYDLSEDDIWKLAKLCRQEQGADDGIRAEMSLILNRYEAFASADISIVDYVIQSKWWSRASYWMNNGTASKADFESIKDVLSGNRFFPNNIDEHDCLSDIKSVSNNGVEFSKYDRTKYTQGITKIKNTYGSKYTFWCFPDSYSDPFGYTGDIKRRETALATRDEIVRLAKSMVGRNESDGTHRYFIDTYNAHTPLARGYKVQYDDAWCATFISFLSIVCGCTDIIPTECGCEEMIELFKRIGEWVENDAYVPNIGDIIFYDWQDSGDGDNTGHSDHVGIVEYTNGNEIIVIEGNKNDAVERRTVLVGGKYIRGFGVPKYAKEEMPITYTFSVRSIYKGVQGNDVLLLAEILGKRKYYNLGISPNMKCDDSLVKAINAYQDDRRKQGVELGTDGHSDGICGKKMWRDILGL